MEDIHPLTAPRLSHENWLTLLCNFIDALQIEDVSFTGGEPLLNNQLDAITDEVRGRVSRLELNTNGLLITPEHLHLFSKFDRVKISIDSLNAIKFDEVTNNRSTKSLQDVISGIKIAIDSGTDVAINAVVTKDTIDGIQELIDWSKQLGITLQLFDFYFNEERRDYWQEVYMPIDEILPLVEKNYGEIRTETPQTGCQYFQAGGNNTLPGMRIKSSFSATTRSETCKTCPAYCQEGVYGLRFSTRGYVTYCPTYIDGHGVLLQNGMSSKQIRKLCEQLIHELNTAEIEENTFSIMIGKRNLRLK